jgi:ornithine carbamoyltransferase
LQGKTLAILLEKPSFRTKLSFQVAIESLGGRAIESISNTRKKEEPKDSIRVLNEYCDIVMLRTHDDAHLQEMANYATIPIINGLSALYHPCQVLADLLSLQEHFGALSGLTLTYVGDGNNILHTLLLLAPKVGMTIHYCCPLEHQPNAALLSSAKEHFPQQIKSYTHPLEAVREAHAVYTDVWVSMGFEHHPAEAIFQGFQVNEELMSQARQDAVFMHCMPMERGKEVSGSLPDKPCSIIFSQSKNRLYVQQALLVFLLKTGGGGGRL